ncbi:MAG: T9SS type A sorting domain-containing protein [Cyclobacteriaceae bacterium]
MIKILRKLRITCFVFFAIFASIGTLSAQATRTISNNWGQWSTASTWQGNNQPVNGDLVTSTVNNLNTQIDAAVNLTIASMSFSKPTTIIMYNGANLTVTGDISNSKNLTITLWGGTLTVNGNITSDAALTITNNGSMNVGGAISGKTSVSVTTNTDNDMEITGAITSANGPVTIQGNGNGDRNFGGISAKGNLAITKNGSGAMIFGGDVASSSGNITLTGNGGLLEIQGTVDGNNDVDIVSNSGTIHVTGGVNAGNDASFTANGNLEIEGVVAVQNNASFTGNGGSTFEMGGLTGGNNTSLTFNGDATINGDVNLGMGTAVTVNSGTTMITGSFTSGGNGDYTVFSNLVVGEDLSLDGGTDNIGGSGTVTTGGTCSFDTGGSTGISQNCSVTTPIALPVSLLTFISRTENLHVTLQWITASELNNDFFTLEKSFDGINFSELSNVEGSGTSKELQIYQYIDMEHSGVVYYRLSQTDYDGTYEILDAIRVGSASSLVKPSCYPNPLSQTRELTLDHVTVDMGWQIFQASGSLIMGGNFLGGNKLDLSDLTKGLYFLMISSDGFKSTHRIIIE